MTDLDFEELDKAVSSLMAKTPTKPDAGSQEKPAETNTTTPSTTIDEPHVAPVSSDESSSASEELMFGAEATTDADVSSRQEEALSSEVPPAEETSQGEAVRPPKRSGRFMDVVHPSSDMKSPAPSVSRQGVTIQPQASSSISDAMADITKDETPADMVEEDTPKVPDVPKTVVADVLPPVENLDTLSSPFLPDAQVEKRPLGGINMSTEKPEADADADVTMATTETSSNEEVKVNDDTAKKIEEALAQSEEVHEEPKISLPEELSNDLVAIESGEVSTKAVDPGVAPVQDDIEPEKPVPSIVHELQETTTPEPVMGSIPQQYTEVVPETEAVHSPIYDDVAAQPVIVPPKKKTKALVIILVLIGIVLAVAIAAGLYFMNLL